LTDLLSKLHCHLSMCLLAIV